MRIMDQPQAEPPDLDLAEQPSALAGLVAQACAGDEEAWTELISLYSRRVFALSVASLRSPDTAEEITQSVMVTIAEKLTSGAYTEQGRFEPWLFRITMNRVRDEVRCLKRQPRPLDQLPPAAAATDHSDDLRALRRALPALPAADRELLSLRHHAQLSFPDIAETLGQPLGTVLARHHRALKKLRTLIETPS